MAGISHVYTIARAAELLGVDKNLLHELSIDMDPQDGCLWVCSPGDECTVAFTPDGIECLREMIADSQK